ncbi:hypothetical protein MRB53_000351 [Persea americana]|uniref:Uncharacterized protein n=1 Tax=Persea americana TaxID=3435 RepID=A0ACC2MPE8_PERAE|nr:hypothetical protein MRB53_000351 [Persea americana]
MSAFRDTSHPNSWDFSAFICTFALYIDEQLEFHMHHRLSTLSVNDDEDVVEEDPALVTPLHEMKIDYIFTMIQRLQQLLQRFLSCQPTGAVKSNQLVFFALHPIVKESFQLYYDITEIMGVLIDWFMMLENFDCVKVLEIFSRIARQFDDLDTFYAWCKKACIARSSDYPEVERITSKKLKVMEEFIHEKSTLVQQQKEKHQELEIEIDQEPDIEQPAKDDLTTLKALPEPENSIEVAHEEEKREETKEEEKEKKNMEEVDLLNLRECTVSIEEGGDKLALVLFSGESTPPSAWEAFVDSSTDWETALEQSTSSLSNQKASLGGGFDMLMLDGMYQQVETMAVPSSRSASRIACVGGTPGLLAFPTPLVGGGSEDPFAASLAVAPLAYVQMSEMEKKHQLLMEEQLMWQQYVKNLESKPYVV